MNTYWLVGKAEDTESSSSSIHSVMNEKKKDRSSVEETKVDRGNLEELDTEQQRTQNSKESRELFERQGSSS